MTDSTDQPDLPGRQELDDQPGVTASPVEADVAAATEQADVSAAENTDEASSKFEEIVATRRAKVDALREAGVDPYPVRFRPTGTLADIRQRYGDLEAATGSGVVASVAGRVVGRRQLGRLQFLVLREDGVDLQLLCMHSVLDDAAKVVLEHLDVGDWLGAAGEIVCSKTGELSVQPTSLTMLGKGLRPLPDKWHGLTDTEARFRQREVDLVVNDDARRVFAVRSATVASLRRAMESRGFVEVETPMLHPIPGGATARPFVTHHHTLDVDLYLRIAPELYLKRLVAGGMRRVFEINRNFRNEGMSTRHNPEFTMLESYAAYDDYFDVMELTETLLSTAAMDAVGTVALTYQGREVSLAPPFRRVALLDLVREATGHSDLAYDTPADEVRTLCRQHGIDPQASWGVGKLVLELYEALVESNLWEPTFVLDYPVEVSPLARRHRDDAHVTERFELIVTGRELANAFSELVDPDDQRRRFEAQAAAKAAGDDEAMVVDESYLRALELGMPPAGGLGLGVDRLVMLLADVANIRDVILFPTLRPETTR